MRSLPCLRMGVGGVGQGAETGGGGREWGRRGWVGSCGGVTDVQWYPLRGLARWEPQILQSLLVWGWRLRCCRYRPTVVDRGLTVHVKAETVNSIKCGVGVASNEIRNNSISQKTKDWGLMVTGDFRGRPWEGHWIFSRKGCLMLMRSLI